MIKNSTSLAYEASRVVCNNKSTLVGLSGYNSKGSAQFIQLYDSRILPPDTTGVPVWVITVPATSNFSVDFGEGRPFHYGIVVGNSSTGPTKTIGSADCWFDCQYKEG